MNEMNGLANILGNAETLHTLEEPPVREEWNTEEEFQDALSAYSCRMMLWKVERREAP